MCPLQRKSWVALQKVQWTIVKYCSILASIAVEIMFNNKPPSSLLSSFSYTKFWLMLFWKYQIDGISRELAANTLLYFSCKHTTHLSLLIILNMELATHSFVWLYLKGHSFLLSFPSCNLDFFVYRYPITKDCSYPIVPDCFIMNAQVNESINMCLCIQHVKFMAVFNCRYNHEKSISTYVHIF